MRLLTTKSAYGVFALAVVLFAFVTVSPAVASQGGRTVVNGRPVFTVDGIATSLPGYSPVAARRQDLFKRQVARFFSHRMGAYLIELPGGKVDGDWGASAFWSGNTVSDRPIVTPLYSLDDAVESVLKGDPSAKIIIRMGDVEPKSWRDINKDDLFVNDDGKLLDSPSLASSKWLSLATSYNADIVRYCESRPWSNHLIGYANFTRYEGGNAALYTHNLFDHSPVMTARWRAYLRAKYGSDASLQAAFHDPSVTLDTVEAPRDNLRGSEVDLAALLYWQPQSENQPLRDYLMLQRDLFHGWFTSLVAGMRAGTTRKRVFLYDALKGTMQGWDVTGFFDENASWQSAYPDTMAGSGNIDETALLDIPGFDGLVTPHDYQVRGPGGIFEPEGSADSVVLRGKLFYCEMDTRSYTGNPRDQFGMSRNDSDFAAVTWRNWATAWTRGFCCYYMDVWTDWFASPGIQKTIQRQVEVDRQSVQWPHKDVPGIAVILDDRAALETNGNGLPLNELVMWELKMGVSRCGVPYRVYQFDDLSLPNFPAHKIFYFPDLFRVTDDRLALLKRKVFRNGNVVVWGPGSGISDGAQIGVSSAKRLTGFHFELLPANYPRRTQITNYDNTITRNLSADAIYGSPTAYGPVLYPNDGDLLGLAWTKQGKPLAGLAVKYFGKCADGPPKPGIRYGGGDWTSVFTTSSPIPADIWRGLAKQSGTHVYCDSNDILLADSSVVAIHTVKPGRKTIRLPRECTVTDLVTGDLVSRKTNKLSFTMGSPETRVFLLRDPASPVGGRK